MMQSRDLINSVSGDTDGDTAPYWLSRGSLVPGRFATAVFVRALDLRGPHAKAAISGAVLGLSVLDLADRVGRRHIL